jgi:peptidoglycan hydrolase-like protein with peptidoglycan-binding domain
VIGTRVIVRNNVLIRIFLVAGVALLVALGSLVAYGSVWGFDNPSAVAVGGPAATLPATTAPSSSTSTSSTLPATTTTAPKMPEPPRKIMPAVPSGGFGQGSSGPAILAYEQRLHDLHFDPGPVDGRFDQDTRYAIEAIQKMWALPRTGRIDPSMRSVLTDFRYPQPLVKHPAADRVEIDLDHQVLVVWRAYKITLITTTSTGSGRYFCGGDSGCQYAVTPPGTYKLQWHVNGWRKSKLGVLWNPYYFNGGIAVHGLAQVPVYPASHGCARIPMHIADYFATLVYRGEAVYVVGTPAPHSGTPSGVTGSGNTSPPTASTQPPTSSTGPTVTTHPATTTTHPTTTTHHTTTTTHPATTTT